MLNSDGVLTRSHNPQPHKKKKKDQIAIVSVWHFLPNRWTDELNSSSSPSLPHYLNETRYQIDDCTIWNRLYVISYQMERAEKTCFIHCVKFIVSFILCKFHKFSWKLATDLWEQSVLHQLNQDVSIFLYIHWRLLKHQTQDILTGQIRLKRDRSKLQMACNNDVNRESSFWELEWQLWWAPWDAFFADVFRNSIFKSVMATTQKYFLKENRRTYCFLSI